MKNIVAFLGALAVGLMALLLATAIVAPLTPFGRSIINQWKFSLHKVDDRTRYETLRKVEDTCRAMRASYTADQLTCEQYRNGSAEQQGWAAQAMMRANKTAATYNEFILKNNFVLKDGVPPDAFAALSILTPNQ
jgi:hypothetical protein